MTIDQATQSLLQAMAARGGKRIHESTPGEVRAGNAATLARRGQGPEMHSVVDETLTSSDGGEFAVRVLVPTAEPRGTVTYYHGGGWVLGDIDGFDMLGRKLAAAANAVVVLVGYRLAPEHPYPAAVHDAWAALGWVAQRLERLGGASRPLVLGGDSAGANLAIVTALRARSEGPKVDATFLVYPATDSDFERPSYLDPENQLLVGKPAMEWFFGHYLGDHDPTDPDVSPLRVHDLSSFPPTALALAEHDPLRDEGEEFGDRLREAGVPVHQRLFTGQMHGFFQMTDTLPASDEAVAWIAEFLDEQVLSGARAGIRHAS